MGLARCVCELAEGGAVLSAAVLTMLCGVRCGGGVEWAVCCVLRHRCRDGSHTAACCAVRRPATQRRSNTAK